MKKCVIFDLDQTLVDSSLSEPYRNARDWKNAVSCIENFVLYNNMQSVFEYIRENGIKLAIVSSSVSYYVKSVISHFRINADCVIAYHDVTRKKPDPEGMRKVLSSLNVSPDETIAIGDSDFDIIASKSANIFSIGCLWGGGRFIMSNPDVIISDPKDIIFYLQN